MLRPVMWELLELEEKMNRLNPAASVRLNEIRVEIEKILSAGEVFFNIGAPTIIGAFPGWVGGVGSLAFTAWRLYKLNGLASGIVQKATEAISYQRPNSHFTFQATSLPARTIGALSFIGYLNPSEELSTLNDLIDGLESGNVLNANRLLNKFGADVAAYGIEGNGTAGTSFGGNSLSSEFILQGGTFSRRDTAKISR